MITTQPPRYPAALPRTNGIQQRQGLHVVGLVENNQLSTAARNLIQLFAPEGLLLPRTGIPLTALKTALSALTEVNHGIKGVSTIDFLKSAEIGTPGLMRSLVVLLGNNKNAAVIKALQQLKTDESAAQEFTKNLQAPLEQLTSVYDQTKEALLHALIPPMEDASKKKGINTLATELFETLTAPNGLGDEHRLTVKPTTPEQERRLFFQFNASFHKQSAASGLTLTIKEGNFTPSERTHNAPKTEVAAFLQKLQQGSEALKLLLLGLGLKEDNVVSTKRFYESRQQSLLRTALIRPYETLKIIPEKIVVTPKHVLFSNGVPVIPLR